MGHVIFCSDQIDGVAGAAIVARALRLHGKEWRFGGTISHATIEGCKKLHETKNALLHLVDVAPDRLKPLQESLDKLQETNRLAYWCTDATCSTDAVRIIMTAAASADVSSLRSTFCSAELVQRRLLPKDTMAMQLGELGRDIKFWQRKNENAMRLADVLASGFDPKKLVDMLSKGVMWSPTMETTRNAYLKKKEQALAEIGKHLEIKDYVGVKFGFALANNILPSADACQHMLDKNEGVDVMAIIYRNGRIAFRRRNHVDVNLEEVAALFGGGGREYASGGRVSRVATVSGQSFKQVLFSVDRTLKNHFLG